MNAERGDAAAPPDPLDRLLEAAAAHPQAIAVSDPARGSVGDVTYQAFSARVLRLAAAIKARTGAAAPRVLIALRQGADAYAAMFAALAAGGHYAPLNSEAPAARRRAIAESFAPDVIIAETAALDWAPESAPPVIAPPDATAIAPLAQPEPPGLVAYTIFTSGSTGAPKGVVIPRRALAIYLEWAIPALGLGPGVRCSQHPNIAFDLSVIDIYGALCSGATLLPFTSATDRLMPGRAARARGVQVWVSVPSVIDLMQRAGQATAETLGGVRTFFFCGEPLLPAHLEAIFAAAPGAEVINAYGPTEATVSCTELRLTADNHRSACGASVAVGEAIPRMRIALEGGPSPDEGEIVIYGPQVADGYWRDPERTEASFGGRDSGERDARRFRTRDWAVRRGGHLFFVGRIDRQVKRQGHRIELGEIDAALRDRLAGAAAATVLVGGELISFVEADAVDARALRAALAETLPDYMLPQEIRSLAALPRNANDKIDFRALEALAEPEGPA